MSVRADMNNLTNWLGSYNSSYYFKSGVDPMTLTVRGVTIWWPLINYVYIQPSIGCVLLGLGQPKVCRL